MNKQREQGFTLIELLVVAVIVGILATLVAMTYSGVQAKNRNAERQANINTLQSHLETYYAQYSKYPSLGELNDANWRKKNLKDIPADTIKDPRWDTKVASCTKDKTPVLTASPIEKCYTYQATASDGSACTDPKVACAQYSLTAVLEGGEKYVKTSLN